jgi:hypothetical protein
MNQEKYIGMDVHDASISAAVMNAQGKLHVRAVPRGLEAHGPDLRSILGV